MDVVLLGHGVRTSMVWPTLGSRTAKEQNRTANLLRNLPLKKKFVNRLRLDRSMVMSLWPRFLAHHVDVAMRSEEDRATAIGNMH